MDTLRDDLVEKLAQIAAREQRSINEVVETMLAAYRPPAPRLDPALTAALAASTLSEADRAEIEKYPPGSAARLAAAARSMPAFPTSGDVSEHADEILREEFADYLFARMNRPEDPNDNSISG